MTDSDRKKLKWFVDENLVRTICGKLNVFLDLEITDVLGAEIDNFSAMTKRERDEFTDLHSARMFLAGKFSDIMHAAFISAACRFKDSANSLIEDDTLYW